MIKRAIIKITKVDARGIGMKLIHPALMFAGALLIVISVGCSEKTGPGGKKPASPVSAVPVVPQAEIVVEGVPLEEQPALKSLLRVDGVIRRGSEYVVALNGQVVKAGEFLRFTVNKKTYILEVMKITAQSILLKATNKGGEGAATVPSPAPTAAQ
jgi:hypothetical protein